MRRCLGCLLLAVSLLHPGSGLASDPAGAAASPLTLGRAVEIALHNNPGLRQSVNQVASGEVNLARKRADFAPDLRLSLSANERFDKALDPLNGDRDSRNFETAGGALASTLNLFNGFGDTAALRGAEQELAGLRDSLSRDEQTLIFETISRFLEALTSRELIGVRRENLEGNRRQLERVEALHRAGNRPVSDLYQQQAEAGSAELDLLLAERDDVVARLQLLQTIGIPPRSGVELAVADLAPLEAALVTLPAASLSAEELAGRPDLSARQKRIVAAREQVTAATAGYWPSLDLSASLDSAYSSLNEAGFGRQFFDDNSAGRIGLALSVPLFDRYLTRHNVAQARLRQHDAELALAGLALQADAEHSQAVADFQTAQKLIGVTEARLVAAREALAAMEERYRVGAATLVELTQARTAFTAAGFERVKARFGLFRQRVALVYYRGDWGELRTLLTRLESLQ
jgi:outer membrane protein